MCKKGGKIEACYEAQVPILGLMSWGPFLFHLSSVARPLEWALSVMHLSFPSPSAR